MPNYETFQRQHSMLSFFVSTIPERKEGNG
jgi:hypothetical protein